MRADPLAFPAGAAGRGVVVPFRRRTTRRAAAVGVGTPMAFALAIASGMAWAAGFPPVSWPFAPWVALAPFLIACASLSPGRAALAGTCWATAAAVGVASFLPAMLSRYFGLAQLPTWAATMVVVGGLHGLYVSAYAAWIAWLVRRRRANPVLLACGWLACEFARAHDGFSSPWGLAAYSQREWTTIVQIADLAGPYGIGLLVAAVNAGIAAVVMPALRGRRPWLSAVVIAVGLGAACVYGQWRLGQTFGDGAPIGVAVVQGGAAPDARRLERYVSLTASGADAGTDLVGWPEYAVDGYLDEASPARDAVLGLSASMSADLVLGGAHWESAAGGTQYHNSAYLVRRGHIAARYDKHRLVPFAENAYTPGPGKFILPAVARVGTLLCVESMFPDVVRRAAAQGAEVLVNVSNDAWFGDAQPARQQLEIAALRAVETRRYLVRAAATGISAVIDPYGRTLTESAWGANQVLNATVRASHVRTPYERWGDALAWMVIAVVVGASVRSATHDHHRGREA
jgi:apolipoprotein N-acyltransferase